VAAVTGGLTAANIPITRNELKPAGVEVFQDKELGMGPWLYIRIIIAETSVDFGYAICFRDGLSQLFDQSNLVYR
jgi:hypothetical protein